MTEREELEELKKLRGKIIAALNEAAEGAAVASYSLSEGGGSQSASRRNPADLMKWLKETDKEIAAAERRLSAGGGIRFFGTDRYA